MCALLISITKQNNRPPLNNLVIYTYKDFTRSIKYLILQQHFHLDSCYFVELKLLELAISSKVLLSDPISMMYENIIYNPLT